MAKKKPDNTALGDQLKGLAQKMEADKAAQTAAEKHARERQKQQETDARIARESGVSDEERFERAVSGINRADHVKKFDDSPRARREALQTAEPKKNDDDLFMEAMGRPPPKPEKKG